MKICSKCKEEKQISDFAKASNKKLAIRSQCKSCDRKYRTLNIKRISEYGKNYTSKNTLINKEYQKKYREKNIDVLKEKSKVKREKTKEDIKIRSKIYYEKNKDLMKIKNNKYRTENKDFLREKSRLRNIERRKKDPIFKLRINISRLISISLTNKKLVKSKKTIDILGCEIVFFKKYLESKFEPWMNWENRGLCNGSKEYGWDLDHIKPISLAKDEKEVLELNHYTNFQPLCSFNNRCIKKNNYE